MKFESGGQETARKPKKKRGVSFYAAVVLCVAAVVLAVASDRIKKSVSRGEEQPSGMSVGSSDDYYRLPSVDEQQMNAELPDPSILEFTPVVSTTTTTTATTTAATAPTTAATRMAVQASAPLSFRMPTEGGEVCGGFSGDELVYCATMCDWRVHNGIDIAGKTGAPVLACADGVVENFAADMLFGNTAVIRHSDDTVVYYCGLNDTQMVSAGLQVKAGDVIGYIGEVPCELGDGAHIHLVMMKDGKFIDPAPLLGAA